MNPSLSSFLKAVGALVTILTALAIGYALGTRSQGIEPDTSQEPLVKISYSGGMLIDDADVTSWKAIYSDGRVVAATRKGEITELASITAPQVAELREFINAPDFVEAGFPKSERQFCQSAVDGIDTEIELTRDNGKTVSYSDCEYDLYGDYLRLLTVVNFLTRQAND